MSGNDLFLSSKAMSSTYTPQAQQPILRRINEVSPSLREEAGFFTNPLESTLKWLSVPQQVLYSLGKNMGEELMQRELDPNQGFFKDMERAFTGKGDITFNNVLKSVDLDGLDLALPEEYAAFFKENYLATIPASFAAGILGTLAGGPVAGLTAGFSTFSFLQGKGGISSVADVVFDPLNKLRLLPKTAKGLGLSDDTFKELQRTGRLEDFVMTGKARVPVKGSKPATEDLFQTTVKGNPEAFDALRNSSKGMLDDAEILKNGDFLVTTNQGGLNLLADATADGLTVVKNTRIARKGEAGVFATIKMDDTHASLIGSILQGDRKFFDFRGNSGFVITENTPLIGKFLLPGHSSIDLAAATNILPAQFIDIAKDNIGRAIAKIPGVGSGIDSIAQFEKFRVAPVTDAAARTILKPFREFLIPGAEVGIRGRKAFVEAISDERLGGVALKNKFKADFNLPADMPDHEVFNHVDTVLSRMKAEEFSANSATRQKALSEKKNLLTAITNVKVNKLDKFSKTRVGSVIGPDGLAREYEAQLRLLNVTPNDLANIPAMTEKQVILNTDQALHDIAKIDTMEENEAAGMLERFISAKMDELVKIDALEKTNPEMAKKMIDDAKPSVPQSKVLDYESLPKVWEEAKKKDAHNQIFTKFGSALHKHGKLLRAQLKDAKSNTKGLDDVSKTKSIDEIEKSLDALEEHESVIMNMVGGNYLGKGSTKNQIKNVELMQRALQQVLDLKSLDMTDLLNFSTPEITGFKEMMKLLGPTNAKRIGIQFDSAAALGKTNESDFLVAEMVQNFDPAAAHDLILRFSKTASFSDSSGIMGNALWEILTDTQKSKLSDIFGMGGDMAATNNRFITTVKNAMINPGGIQKRMDRESAGFIGKIIDGFRKILAFINFPKWARTLEKRTEEKLFNFIQGEELNLLSKELKGDEFSATKTLFDPKTNQMKVGAAEELRRINNNTTQALVDADYMREVDGVTADFDHVIHHTRRLKETTQTKAYDTAKSAMDASIGNRGTIGPDQYRDLQRFVNPEHNPQVYNELIETSVVSKSQLDEFLSLDDLTSTRSINTTASATVNRMLEYTRALPKTAFKNEFGALIQGQEAVLKSKEAIPSTRFIQDYLSFTSKEAIQADKSRTFRQAMNRVSLTHSLEGGTTLQDNPNYGALLNTVLDTIERAEPGSLSDNLRFIKSQLRNNKSMTPEQFRGLQKAIGDLDSKLPAEHAVLVESDRFIKDIFEKEGDQLLVQEGLIDQIVLDPKTAASMKETLRIRLRSLSDPTVDETLAKEIKGLLREGFDDDGVQSISKAMEAAQINTFRAEGRRRVQQTTAGAGADEKGFATFSVYNKPMGKGGTNPLEEQFDGMHIPDFMHPVITKPKTETWEQMSTLKKVMTTLFEGMTEGQAKARTQGVNTAFQKFFNKPEMNIVGDRFEQVLQGANYDYLLNIWKGHALVSPAFHVRNALSAFFVNSQHGVDPASHKIAAEAAAFLRGDSEGIIGLTRRGLAGTRNKYDPTKVRVVNGQVEMLDATIQGKERELYELIAKSQNGGILAGGAGEEIAEDIGRASRGDGGSLNPLSHDFGLLKLNQEAAGFTEDLVRMAAVHHADTVLKYSIEDAGNMAKALHFDYNLLTDFERGKMKRILPFYTYTRKAIARDSRMFMERTGQYYRLSSMVAAMQGDTPEKQEAVSGFIKDSLGVDFFVDDNGKHHYLLLGGLIPAADMVSMASAGIETTKTGLFVSPSEALKKLAFQFGRQASPFLKSTLEYTFNYDMYFNKPLKRIQGEQADLFGVAVPKDMAALVQSVRFLRDLDKITHAAFNLKNPVNPNLPSSFEQEMGVSSKFMKGILGINLSANDRPQDNLYFNKILPEKKQRQALKSDISRQARKGPNPNLTQAIENLKAFEIQKQADAVQEQHADNRINIFNRK